MIKNKLAQIKFSKLPSGLILIIMLGVGLIALAVFGISMYILYNQLF